MKTESLSNRLNNRLRKNAGFTLIEIMVAVAILGILMAGIYGLFTSMYNSYIAQNQLSDVEQNARIGIEQMIREIRLAGFNAFNQNGGLQVYKTTGTDFVFQEEVQPILGAGLVVNKKIEYSWDSTNNVLLRGEEQWSTTAGVGGSYGYPSDNNPIGQQPLMNTGSLQTLSIPVTNLSFVYYDANNVQFTPSSTSNFTTITRVRISLTTQGKNPSPDKIGVKVGGVYYKQVTVDADIRLRNMGIGQANGYTKPPSPPTGVKVYDTGNPCASLTVSWNANTEVDLAGYVVYIRPTGSGMQFSGTIAGNVTTFVIQNLTIGQTYDVALKAYNTMGNMSGYSSTVSSPWTGSGDGHQPDTQPNILAPASPTITQATAGNSQVTLTWTASSTGNVNGYNIYRSAWSGTGYGSFVLVNQNGPETGTTFTDTFTDPSAPVAPNCPLTYKNPHPYQYKMASVDCGGSGAIGAYSSTISGGDGQTPYNTYPKDMAIPSDPTNFVAGPGSQQVFLSWNAPASPDVMGVRILSKDNSSVPPTISSFSRTVYEDSAVISPYQSYGTVDSGQNLTGPALTPMPNYQTYAYTAFSFDKCGNVSPGSGSTTSATPCGDLSWPGAPGPPSLLNGSNYGGIVTLNWNAPTTNTLPSPVTGSNSNYSANPSPTIPPTPVWDLSGYNVYRCAYVSGAPTQICDRSHAVDYNGIAGNPLNATPVLSPTFNDTKVSPGQIWLYAVTAIDCKYPSNPIPNSGHESLYAADTNGGSPQNYVQVSVGGLAQDVYLAYGTSTGTNNSVTTLYDTAKGFSTSSTQAYSTGTLKITAGTDAGQWRPVIANSATSVTIPANYPWSAAPDATSVYEIDRPITANSSNPSTNPLAHDDVTFWVQNTNPASINIRSTVDTAAITWSNYLGAAGADKSGASVYLSAIKVNGTLLWSTPLYTVTSGTNVTFTSNVSLGGLASGVPMELIFADANGNPPNMKGETINISMTYQLVNQDGTFANGTWITGVGGVQPITVPYGIWFYPYCWGSMYQWPSSIYSGCPGSTLATTSSLTNILPEGSGTVTFITEPIEGGGSIPMSATLYYCKQSYAGSASWGSNVTSTAPGPTNSCWSSMNMTLSSTGTWWNLASASIPEAGDPYRIWYYVQTTDNIGNFSTNPSYNINGMDAYTYDQNDAFSPSFTLSWTTAASTNGKYALQITGTVGDLGNVTNNTAGATLNPVNFTGTTYGTNGPLTFTLGAGSNTFTSGYVFGANEKGNVTFQLQKSGFKSMFCTPSSQINNRSSNPPAVSIICS